MSDLFLYEKITAYNEISKESAVLPEIIQNGLSAKIELREYQQEAINNFITYRENAKLVKNRQVHSLFHMATGSGKTVVMASLILYLYTKGYRKFLFFVNQTNILEKTKENFTNKLSSKYLFNSELKHLGESINIKMVDNFSDVEAENDIEIVFTTTQKLHMDLFLPKENTVTCKDFSDHKIVFISDESHHINSMTKKQLESEEVKSWEHSVMSAFHAHTDNIMLEFTATADLADKNVMAKYKDKIVYDYSLIKFRKSGYTKDFKNFAADLDLWQRTLVALILSEYRRFLFADLKLNIKPVVLLKSQKIKESEEFYDEFFNRLAQLTSYEIAELKNLNNDLLRKAIDYFEAKDETLELLEHSIQDSFIKENSIIMNGASDYNKENQILINSLEDHSNHIRFIFAVDMLNEGWDVLNLFDIVRLYDTRQGSGRAGKVGAYTIREAQLIGRGARYCPFIISEDQDKFKRKFDDNLNSIHRILETMLFHSKNDSNYIAELKQALIATGLQDSTAIELEYKLKDNFKGSKIYTEGLIFANQRKVKSRDGVIAVEGSLKSGRYYYEVPSKVITITSLFGGKNYDEHNQTKEKRQTKVIKFKDVAYNILLGASEKFNNLKFNVIRKKYPNLTSLKQFLTSQDYLGNSSLEITHSDDLTTIDLYNACKNACVSLDKHISELKPSYIGTTTFYPQRIKDVVKDKKILISEIDKNGGKGASQVKNENKLYQLDLDDKDWYVFNDNYGTNEEKLFLKYFETDIKPILEAKNLEFYIIRNERIANLAIYSFDSGERFEPDFLLLVRKKDLDRNSDSQIYIEPKGLHLLSIDSWKEEFMLQIKDLHKMDECFNDDTFKIIGMPFFNSKEEERKQKFESSINEVIANL